MKTYKKSEKKKLPAGVTEEFIDEVGAASENDLRAMIVRFQAGIDEAQTFLKTNEGVLELKEAYQEAAAPSRETIRALRNRTKVVLDALKTDTTTSEASQE